ncbi:DUF6518 family protein [Nocardioides sp. T2.26MG-1]|uniref:DUF6518 family protein n=1 Tax=Nocardioides sp. T2.26MG-1 TaxID=3041166 RepID=UPI00247798D1|nr:DUF6518 family protein [Nocardioides sp. T2.26MG-1]CAI9418894.1 hypothetical protein HIDPHFAB_03430 [Nocardioides sp. T2.26MG-1]
MTTMQAPGLATTPVSPTVSWPRAAAAVPISAAAGVLLGVGDLWWNINSPGPWATVANSCAGWAIAPFVLGALLTLVLRTGAATAAASGVVMLGVAVEAYYVAGVVWLGDDPSIVTSPVAHYWLVLAILVGSTLGAAGAWAAGRSTWLAAPGTALGAALLLGDALQLWQLSYGGTEPEARILALLGVAVLLASLRRPLVTLGALVLCAPLTVAVAACFVGTGVVL